MPASVAILSLRLRSRSFSAHDRWRRAPGRVLQPHQSEPLPGRACHTTTSALTRVLSSGPPPRPAQVIHNRRSDRMTDLDQSTAVHEQLDIPADMDVIV